MRQIEGTQKIEILDAEIVSSYPERLSTVQVSRGYLKKLECDRTAKRLLMGAGAIACFGLGLCFIRLALFPPQQPSVLPSCESNCYVN